MMDLRKNFARIISLVLCFTLVFPISVFAQQSTDDYSRHWAGNQIKSFLDKGFISVDKDGSFKPDNPVTRGDFAAIANKAFGFTEKDETNFKDVEVNESYYNDISIAKKAGYFVGLPDGTVMPKGYMSRQEYALIISRLLKLDTTKYINEAKNFKDAAAVPDWSKGAVGAVAKAGYMQGEPGNVFNPKGFITRGQAVAVLERCYLDNVKVAYNKPGTYSAGVIEGNAAINVPDVTLENTTITGNLIIGEGVGNGNVKLKNVVVKGDTVVKGGGLNSIIIEDSQIKSIIIIKEDNKVRIVAVGKTTVERVDMQSGGKLEEQGTTGTGFGYVTIAESVDPNEPIILMGNFDSVQIQSDGVKLDVASGSIAKLDVAPTAANTQINLAEGVKVTELIVAAKSEVTGTGTIETADVKVQETVITVPTTTTKTAEGVTVATSLPTTTPAPAPAPAPTPAPSTPTTGGSSGGGGSSRDDDKDKNISVSAITVTGAGNATAITADNGTLQMFAAVTPTNATNKSVTWSVINGNGEAKISNTGLLTAVSNGTVTVKATAKDGSGKYGTKVITISNQRPPIIFTSSTVAKGTVNPDIVVNLVNDTFTAEGISNLPSNWTDSVGTTGLTTGTISRDTDTQITFHMNGTAQAGALTLKAKAEAFTSGVESNTITIFVLGEAPVERGTIETAESINGIVDDEPTINGQSITFNGEVAYYRANESNGVFISGNWVGVKITAPEGVTPDENAVLYVNGRNINAGENPGWGNIKEEGDGDNYLHIYQRITDIDRVYNITIKWNNDLTEVYTIDIADSATLEAAHGSIELAEPYNGGENAEPTIKGQSITFNGELAYYVADESNGLPISGNWVGVKITAPEGVMPDENAVLTVHGDNCNLNGEPGWENIREEGDGDNYFHVYQRVRNTAYVYEIEIKWNNDLTETYLIIIPRAATLEVFKMDLEDMIGGARFNYDNAYDYGNISDEAVNALGDAIDAAQSVYDGAADAKTDAVQQGIYAAQDELIAAQDAFFDAFATEISASPALDETNANAVYEEEPLIITLDIVNGIGDFDSELGNYITLGGALSEMSINSVTLVDRDNPEEGTIYNRAVLELTGTVGDSTGDGYIRIEEGGVHGHSHGFIAARGKIEQADTEVNGGENATATINGQEIRFDGEIAYYTANGDNGLPEDGNWVGVKITAPAGVIPDENAVLTSYGEKLGTGWDNIGEEDEDGNYYFHLYQIIPQNKFVYVVEIRWNNESTETYFIFIPGTAKLEVFRTDLGNMIDGARFNYDNAASYGNISDEAVNALGDAIDAAQAVYAETEAVQQEIYAAQDELIAAQDEFFDAYETEIIATSTLDDTVTSAVYDDTDPLVISLRIENGIGDFIPELEDHITLGGALDQMTVMSVNLEVNPEDGITYTGATLELIGKIEDSIYNGTITITEGGVNGHKHGFEVIWTTP